MQLKEYCDRNSNLNERYYDILPGEMKPEQVYFLQASVYEGPMAMAFVYLARPFDFTSFFVLV
jgi:hypothetical protein